MRKIYVASSWRNEIQPAVVTWLKQVGHEVYDFRHPLGEDSDGYHWSDVDPKYKAWTIEEYVASLEHPIAQDGYYLDFNAMEWADTGVLVLPSGASSHIEAGYFKGANKDLFVLMMPGIEWVPELMYKMANKVCTSMEELCGYM